MTRSAMSFDLLPFLPLAYLGGSPQAVISGASTGWLLQCLRDRQT
ncbi:MAG: hypothetical protein P8M80_16050 [Pirellulaceae bacterium]|nr:hypothetical protein [Pirellulaceae bacterium]